MLLSFYKFTKNKEENYCIFRVFSKNRRFFKNGEKTKVFSKLKGKTSESQEANRGGPRSSINREIKSTQESFFQLSHIDHLIGILITCPT